MYNPLRMQPEILYLSRADVESLRLGMEEIIELVADALRERGQGRAEMPPKPGIHPGPPGNDNFVHAMPAYLPGLPAAGIKWVAGYPRNRDRGLPYISGLLILNDPATGLPAAVMDCAWITAMRTAAATAVASRHLGPEDPRTLGVLGCGVQGRTNLEALRIVHPGLRRVQAFDIRPEQTTAYRKEMGARFPDLELTAAGSPEAAVRGADIVVTAGPIRKRPEPAIEAEWFGEGALGVALDYDSYWKPDSMRAADRLVTDDREQLLRTREEGYFADTPAIHADLGEILAGKKPGRRTRSERILCLNLGLAIYDVATGWQLLQLARERGVGTRLPL
ncbi:MAG: ornithine cyclodeaminase family protein [Acidobacteria bacterium]|nr:ornithine cyclodeaminase family protein [Acidobacteriota bacterium]